MIAFWSLYFMDYQWENDNGNTYGIWVFGMTVFTGVVMISNFKILIMTNTFNL